MTRTTARCLPCLLLAVVTAAAASAQSWPPPSPFPSWGAAPPVAVATITFDPTQSATANGALLHSAIDALGPGQGLAIGPGTWCVPHRLDLNGLGTPQAPIWLFALDPAQRPVITRPDAAQNTMNIGSNAPARYWVLRDLELTGGADLLRLYDCAHVWIDRCHLHDGLGVGIAANTLDTDHLWITRNEIARPGPGTTGEGMYLGANFGSATTSWSVIAANHVHGTRGAIAGQGDGIELKQGSHHNWLLGNHVHDCRNPCILVYGTGGNAPNVIERNLCYDSDDVVLQVQGEAIVRNNVAIGGSFAFSSHDHQGQSRDLWCVHNTFVNQGTAASMAAWNGRPGMTFANNVAYSTGGAALAFGNGSAGVQMAGNVVLGNVIGASSGWVTGAGLQDFADVTLNPLHVDVRPTIAGAIDNRGSAAFAVATDLLGIARTLPVDPGAATNTATLHSPTAQIQLSTGGGQLLLFDAPALAGADYHVLGSISGVLPGLQLGAFTLPLQTDAWFLTTLTQANAGVLVSTHGVIGATGQAAAAVLVPPLPSALHGLALDHALVASANGAIVFVSNPVRVVLQ